MSIASASVCALVLAGRRSTGTPDPIAAAAGVPVKALVQINGRTMLERVVSSLHRCPEIGEIHVSLPDDVTLSGYPQLAAEFAAGALQRVPPAASPSASVREFVTARVQRQTVLATTADHPLLTSEMVQEFLRSFAASGAEAAVALTDAPRIAARYPASRRTQLRFTDGRFTGCNLFAFHGAGALHVLDFWRQIDQHRKHPWQLARALGSGTLALYLCGRLSLPNAIARLSERSGSRLHAVQLEDPHAGIDVDKLEDLQLVTSILEQRENARTEAGAL